MEPTQAVKKTIFIDISSFHFSSLSTNTESAGYLLEKQTNGCWHFKRVLLCSSSDKSSVAISHLVRVMSQDARGSRIKKILEFFAALETSLLQQFTY